MFRVFRFCHLVVLYPVSICRLVKTTINFTNVLDYLIHSIQLWVNDLVSSSFTWTHVHRMTATARFLAIRDKELKCCSFWMEWWTMINFLDPCLREGPMNSAPSSFHPSIRTLNNISRLAHLFFWNLARWWRAIIQLGWQCLIFQEKSGMPRNWKKVTQMTPKLFLLLFNQSFFVTFSANAF